MGERKVCIVFGGSTGLGAGCRAVLGEDYQVVNCDIAEAGGVPFFECDITKRRLVELAFEFAAQFGPVAGVVNCAGIYPRRDLLDISEQDWTDSFRVNLLGCYEVYRAAALAHLARKEAGRTLRVVGVATTNAFMAHPSNAHYAATKSAVVSLTKSFALRFAPDRIFYNGVAPGAIRNPRVENQDWFKHYEAHNPVGRAAEPEDIAKAIRFLLSEDNTYVVGETLLVAGGNLFRQ